MRVVSLLVLLLSALVALGPSEATAQDLLLDYVGYDYEFPDLDNSQFGEVGSGYVGIGLCPVLFAPLVADTVNYEYTYYISGMTSVSVTPVASFLIIDYSGPGTIQIFEDSKNTGTAAQYGILPPNGTAPSSFTDGTLFLEGSLTNFQVILSTTSNSGSYEAVFQVTGGSQFANIPANQVDGWTFAGITGNEINRPEGYAHQVDGQIFLDVPTSVEESSWGHIKRLYR